MNTIFPWLSEALNQHALVASAAAVGWGLASVALSPCHLTSVPLAVAFVRRDVRASTLRLSLALALGLLVSLAVVGAATVAAGRIAGDLWGLGPWLAASALLLAGLFLLDALSLPSFLSIPPDRIPRNSWGAALMGLFLGVTLGPCTFAFFAPVLAAALGIAQSDTLLPVVLISAFSLGHVAAVVMAGQLGLRLSAWISKGGGATARLRGLAGSALLACAVYVIATLP